MTGMQTPVLTNHRRSAKSTEKINARKAQNKETNEKFVTVKLPRATKERYDSIVRNQHKKGIFKFDRGIGLARYVLETHLDYMERAHNDNNSNSGKINMVESP